MLLFLRTAALDVGPSTYGREMAINGEVWLFLLRDHKKTNNQSHVTTTASLSFTFNGISRFKNATVEFLVSRSLRFVNEIGRPTLTIP